MPSTSAYVRTEKRKLLSYLAVPSNLAGASILTFNAASVLLLATGYYTGTTGYVAATECHLVAISVIKALKSADTLKISVTTASYNS